MRAHFRALLFSLVVVRDADRYLLVEETDRPHGPVWYIPAGGVEIGEDFAAAAVRETEEESGLIIAPTGILGADQFLSPDGRSTRIRVVFLAHPTGGLLKTAPDDHSRRAAWFRTDEIARLPLRHLEALEWIRRAEHAAGPPLARFTAL